MEGAEELMVDDIVAHCANPTSPFIGAERFAHGQIAASTRIDPASDLGMRTWAKALDDRAYTVPRRKNL